MKDKLTKKKSKKKANKKINKIKFNMKGGSFLENIKIINKLYGRDGTKYESPDDKAKWNNYINKIISNLSLDNELIIKSLMIKLTSRPITEYGYNNLIGYIIDRINERITDNKSNIYSLTMVNVYFILKTFRKSGTNINAVNELMNKIVSKGEIITRIIAQNHRGITSNIYTGTSTPSTSTPGTSTPRTSTFGTSKSNTSTEKPVYKKITFVDPSAYKLTKTDSDVYKDTLKSINDSNPSGKNTNNPNTATVIASATVSSSYVLENANKLNGPMKGGNKRKHYKMKGGLNSNVLSEAINKGIEIYKFYKPKKTISTTAVFGGDSITKGKKFVNENIDKVITQCFAGNTTKNITGLTKCITNYVSDNTPNEKFNPTIKLILISSFTASFGAAFKIIKNGGKIKRNDINEIVSSSVKNVQNVASKLKNSTNIKKEEYKKTYNSISNTLSKSDTKIINEILESVVPVSEQNTKTVLITTNEKGNLVKNNSGKPIVMNIDPTLIKTNKNGVQTIVNNKGNPLTNNKGNLIVISKNNNNKKDTSKSSEQSKNNNNSSSVDNIFVQSIKNGYNTYIYKKNTNNIDNATDDAIDETIETIIKASGNLDNNANIITTILVAAVATISVILLIYKDTKGNFNADYKRIAGKAAMNAYQKVIQTSTNANILNNINGTSNLAKDYAEKGIDNYIMPGNNNVNGSQDIKEFIEIANIVAMSTINSIPIEHVCNIIADRDFINNQTIQQNYNNAIETIRTNFNEFNQRVTAYYTDANNNILGVKNNIRNAIFGAAVVSGISNTIYTCTNANFNQAGLNNPIDNSITTSINNVLSAFVVDQPERDQARNTIYKSIQSANAERNAANNAIQSVSIIANPNADGGAIAYILNGFVAGPLLLTDAARDNNINLTLNPAAPLPVLVAIPPIIIPNDIVPIINNVSAANAGNNIPNNILHAVWISQINIANGYRQQSINAANENDDAREGAVNAVGVAAVNSAAGNYHGLPADPGNRARIAVNNAIIAKANDNANLADMTQAAENGITDIINDADFRNAQNLDAAANAADIVANNLMNTAIGLINQRANAYTAAAAAAAAAGANANAQHAAAQAAIMDAGQDVANTEAAQAAIKAASARALADSLAAHAPPSILNNVVGVLDPTNPNTTNEYRVKLAIQNMRQLIPHIVNGMPADVFNNIVDNAGIIPLENINSGAGNPAILLTIRNNVAKLCVRDGIKVISDVNQNDPNLQLIDDVSSIADFDDDNADNALSMRKLLTAMVATTAGVAIANIPQNIYRVGRLIADEINNINLDPNNPNLYPIKSIVITVYQKINEVATAIVNGIIGNIANVDIKDTIDPIVHTAVVNAFIRIFMRVIMYAGNFIPINQTAAENNPNANQSIVNILNIIQDDNFPVLAQLPASIINNDVGQSVRDRYTFATNKFTESITTSAAARVLITAAAAHANIVAQAADADKIEADAVPIINQANGVSNAINNIFNNIHNNYNNMEQNINDSNVWANELNNQTAAIINEVNEIYANATRIDNTNQLITTAQYKGFIINNQFNPITYINIYRKTIFSAAAATAAAATAVFAKNINSSKIPINIKSVSAMAAACYKVAKRQHFINSVGLNGATINISDRIISETVGQFNGLTNNGSLYPINLNNIFVNGTNVGYNLKHRQNAPQNMNDKIRESIETSTKYIIGSIRIGEFNNINKFIAVSLICGAIATASAIAFSNANGRVIQTMQEATDISRIVSELIIKNIIKYTAYENDIREQYLFKLANINITTQNNEITTNIDNGINHSRPIFNQSIDQSKKDDINYIVAKSDTASMIASQFSIPQQGFVVRNNGTVNRGANITSYNRITQSAIAASISATAMFAIMFNKYGMPINTAKGASALAAAGYHIAKITNPFNNIIGMNDYIKNEFKIDQDVIKETIKEYLKISSVKNKFISIIPRKVNIPQQPPVQGANTQNIFITQINLGVEEGTRDMNNKQRILRSVNKVCENVFNLLVGGAVQPPPPAAAANFNTLGKYINAALMAGSISAATAIMVNELKLTTINNMSTAKENAKIVAVRVIQILQNIAPQAAYGMNTAIDENKIKSYIDKMDENNQTFNINTKNNRNTSKYILTLCSRNVVSAVKNIINIINPLPVQPPQGRLARQPVQPAQYEFINYNDTAKCKILIEIAVTTSVAAVFTCATLFSKVIKFDNVDYASVIAAFGYGVARQYPYFNDTVASALPPPAVPPANATIEQYLYADRPIDFTTLNNTYGEYPLIARNTINRVIPLVNLTHYVFPIPPRYIINNNIFIDSVNNGIEKGILINDFNNDITNNKAINEAAYNSALFVIKQKPIDYYLKMGLQNIKRVGQIAVSPTLDTKKCAAAIILASCVAASAAIAVSNVKEIIINNNDNAILIANLAAKNATKALDDHIRENKTYSDTKLQSNGNVDIDTVINQIFSKNYNIKNTVAIINAVIEPEKAYLKIVRQTPNIGGTNAPNGIPIPAAINDIQQVANQVAQAAVNPIPIPDPLHPLGAQYPRDNPPPDAGFPIIVYDAKTALRISDPTISIQNIAGGGTIDRTETEAAQCISTQLKIFNRANWCVYKTTRIQGSQLNFQQTINFIVSLAAISASATVAFATVVESFNNSSYSINSVSGAAAAAAAGCFYSSITSYLKDTDKREILKIMNSNNSITTNEIIRRTVRIFLPVRDNEINNPIPLQVINPKLTYYQNIGYNDQNRG